MWPWIKRWLDWAMHNLWPMYRLGPRRAEAVHFCYEKAGLTVHDQPIPWNAEAVLVEALVRLPGNRAKADFRLVLPGRLPIEADSLRRQDSGDYHHLVFRFAPPGQPVAAKLLWRSTALGQLTLPSLSREEFLLNLRVVMPTLFVRLGERNVACQTFVSKQCKGVMASGILTSPTSLAPLADLHVEVEFHSEKRGKGCAVQTPLTSSQLAGNQALIHAMPKGFPRRIGSWLATWKVGDRPLTSQRFRAISQPAFQRSLRVTGTRFVVYTENLGTSLLRQMPPLESEDRVGPCFLVASRELGMAGLCPLQVYAVVAGSDQARLLQEQEVLITDGPTLIAPGTVDWKAIDQVSHFELRVKNTLIGQMSLSPAPAAAFTSEGGFKATDEYIWTASAEEELNERLAKLSKNV